METYLLAIYHSRVSRHPALANKVGTKSPAKSFVQAGGYAPRTPISSRPLARPPKMAPFSENGTFFIFMNIIYLEYYNKILF